MCVCLGLAEERCPDEIEIRHQSSGKKIVIMIIHKRTHVFRTVQRKGRMPVCLSVCLSIVRQTNDCVRSFQYNMYMTYYIRIQVYKHCYIDERGSTVAERGIERERERE